MADKNNYHDEIAKQNVLKMREVVKTLPAFCREYFIGIQESTSARTRLAYAYDLRVFFEYLHQENPVCAKQDITEYRLEILDQITRQDIEEYLNYISYYVKDDKEITNDERGKARKPRKQLLDVEKLAAACQGGKYQQVLDIMVDTHELEIMLHTGVLLTQDSL